MNGSRRQGEEGAIAAIGLAAALFPFGYGRPGPALQVVQGTVTSAGRPEPAGVIRFEPALELGITGDGRPLDFDVPRERATPRCDLRVDSADAA